MSKSQPVLAALAILLSWHAAVAGEHCPLKRELHVASQEQAENIALRAAQAYQLSPIPFKCVFHQVSSDGLDKGLPGKFVISFFEKHDDACGGDPRTGPRLFSLVVAEDGALQTDAYGQDVATGAMRPLRCKRH